MYYIRIIHNNVPYYLEFDFCNKKCKVTNDIHKRTYFANTDDIERTIKNFNMFNVCNNEHADLLTAEVVYEKIS